MIWAAMAAEWTDNMKTGLIVGIGRFGTHIAMKLNELGHELMAVDSEEERINRALPYVTNARIGNATNEKFIASLGVGNFDYCIVAIGDDFQSSLETTALLKDHGAKHVLARATSDVHKKFLLRNGADKVVYPEHDAAVRAAFSCGSSNVFDYFELTPDYSITEINVPKAWIGKSVVQVNVRSKYHVNILATKEHGEIHPQPKPDYIFRGKESLMIMGHNNDLRKLIN